MKLVKVKPQLVKVPELRVKARFEEEVWQQFQNSIREAGIVSPIIVCQIAEELVLVDGEHRLQEAIDQGIPQVEAVVFEGDMVDVLTKNLFLDHTRGKTPVSEMVKVIGALYTEYGLDPDQIKEKTGLSRDYIEKLIKISQASPTVLSALDDGRIGLGVAFELCRLPSAIVQEEIMAKTSVIIKPAVKDYKDLVDATLRELENIKEQPPAAAGKKAPPPIYRCEGCKEEVDPKYLKPVFLCPNCFGEVWRIAKARGPEEEKTSEETGGA
ncbi:hypothetical protein ES708_24209 [subsurface metagenome]